jgi:hypothetical protein
VTVDKRREMKPFTIRKAVDPNGTKRDFGLKDASTMKREPVKTATQFI